MSKHHRFTGRELSTLLEQVRDELGAEATILEANKIRTGGVAGFFKTEQYEVVAAPGGSDPELDEHPRTLHLDLIEPDGSPAVGVAVDLYRGDGTLLGSQTIGLQPFDYVELDDPFAVFAPLQRFNMGRRMVRVWS